MVGDFAIKNFSRAFDEEYDIPFDVKLLVITKGSDEETVIMPCHKLVMALSSPVFAKLFFSKKVHVELPYTYNGDAVTMRNMDPEVIKMIVQFCYNKKLDLLSKSLVFLVEFYITAAKFEITDLQVNFVTLFRLKTLFPYAGADLETESYVQGNY